MASPRPCLDAPVATVLTARHDELRSRNAPSLFATPLAWAVADLTRRLVEAEVGLQPHRTAIVVASDECSLGTIRELSGSAANGIVSPLRFAGASPSIVAGLPALEQGIRGPALCLTMRPEHASPAILALIAYWIRYSGIVSVLAIAHHRPRAGGHLLKGLVAGTVDDSLRLGVLQLCDPPPE
jgi:hypothetical protein